MEKPASIISLDEFEKIRPRLGKIVCTSGGFDPIHPGHLSCMLESKKFGDTLVVIVNGDNFLRTKKGRPFQDLETRCAIVSYVRGVDYVFPFEILNDTTVCQALRALRPHVFTKGGDRIDVATIPEWSVCKELGIQIETGVGLDKRWSSSDFLKEWGEFVLGKKEASFIPPQH